MPLAKISSITGFSMAGEKAHGSKPAATVSDSAAAKGLP